MNLIKANNVDDAFIKISKKLLKDGVKVSPRDQLTLELISAFIEVKNPEFMICKLK